MMKSITAIFLSVTIAVGFTQAQSVDTNFEHAGRVEAKMFVPPDVMNGPSHSVGSEAENDGLNNTYFLYSGDNAWSIESTAALQTRIKEIYAIEKLREMKKGEEFAKAMANAGEQKVKNVVGIVTNPVGTLERLPFGASRFFGRIGEAAKGGSTQGEGNVVQNVMGVQKARVALAVKLGVSPYSYNQELQSELLANARAQALGGFVVTAATAAVGGPAGTVLTGLNINQTLQQTLVNTTPDDLRIMNRKKLFALGVSRADADEILMHPWYSPWTETIMIDALSTAGVDPTAFLAKADRALTEHDARYFQRLAQVLAAYSQKNRLRSIRVESGVISTQDVNGKVMIPLSCDYAIWSEGNADLFNEFAKLLQGESDVKGVVLWVDGRISDRARQEMKQRSVEVATEVLTKSGG